MKIQISLLRGLMANSFLWILPEVFCAYTRTCFLLLPCTLLLVRDAAFHILLFSSCMVFLV